MLLLLLLLMMMMMLMMAATTALCWQQLPNMPSTYAARHAHCLQVLTTLLPLLDGEDAVWLQQRTLPLRQFQARA